MLKTIGASLVCLVALGAAGQDDHGHDVLVRFRGGVGVIPVSAGQGTDATATVVTRNIVRGVQPPGQIWHLDDLRATVRNDGHIVVRGHGLLLAGGNAIGTVAGQRVMATLICEATAPFTLRNTGLVPLQPDGDFQIDDVLTPAPVGCASPVLLIRNAGGAWFAAGFIDDDHDD
jgi:hypothetical protein